MPRLTKTQQAALAAQDAQIIDRVNAWQQKLDAEEVDPATACMTMMQSTLRTLYPELNAESPVLLDHLQLLFPGVNDPARMFQLVSEKLAVMTAEEFESLLREPVFAFNLHSGVDDIYTQLASLDNYFGMLNAETADHLEWINIYISQYNELRKIWWQAVPVRGNQRQALMAVLASTIYILCRPAVFREKFYEFVFGLRMPRRSVLMSDDSDLDFLFEGYEEENKVGTSAARGLAEIELSIRMITNLFTAHPDVLARLQSGV